MFTVIKQCMRLGHTWKLSLRMDVLLYTHINNKGEAQRVFTFALWGIKIAPELVV